MEENLINGEVEEELNCGADHCSDVLCCCFVTPIKADENVLECGVKPCREADKCNCENYVNGKSNSYICTGIEGLFFVYKESNDLSNNVSSVAYDEVAETTDCSGINEYEPAEILCVEILDSRDKVECVKKYKLYYHCKKAYNDELNKLPNCNEK